LVIGGAGEFDSPLPCAEVEAKEISRILGCEAVIGKDATKNYVCSNIQEKDIISMSCHADFNTREALNSPIILPAGEKLTARELFDMKINSDLVSLSACQTAQSDTSPGDEMFGLVRSTIFAGAKSIIASLWKVNDLAGYLTVTKFYENFFVARFNKGESLRKAQLYVRDLNAKDLLQVIEKLPQKKIDILKYAQDTLDLASVSPEIKIFDHMFYWAPFVLIGDWKLQATR
jgi:CHAT domain-containing protein